MGGLLSQVMRFAKSCITLVEAKRSDDASFFDYAPEATGQAVALCEVTGCVASHFIAIRHSKFSSSLPTVRYCMSDGSNWLFALFTKDANGNRVCYESHQVSITYTPRATALFRKDVHQVVELLYHWVCDRVERCSFLLIYSVSLSLKWIL
jgi:hypothetical protein